MATNGILKLDTNYIQVGLGTLTFTVPATVSALSVPVVNVPFSVRCQVTIPQALITGAGAGSGLQNGHGAGAGGGDASGMALGGNGPGEGGVGQGFGPVPNNYQQPPIDVITPTTGPLISSTLSIVVNLNGSPVFTAPAFASRQSSLQFKTPGFLCNAADTITVVFSSSTLSDEQLQGINSNVSVTQGS